MVEYRIENGTLTCLFSGSLNSEVCSGIGDDLGSQVAEAGGPVVFDLQRVDYIASSFLRICQKTFTTVGQKKFSLVNVSPSVKKVFKITGFDKFMNVQ